MYWQTIEFQPHARHFVKGRRGSERHKALACTEFTLLCGRQYTKIQIAIDSRKKNKAGESQGTEIGEGAGLKAVSIVWPSRAF